MAETNDVTTRFRVDVSDLKKGITEANREIKGLTAELKNANAGMEKGEESVDSLTKKLEIQQKIVAQEEAKLASLKEELARYNAKVRDGEDVIADLTRKQEEAARQYGETSDEAKKYAKQLAEAQTQQERNRIAAQNLNTQVINQDTAVKNAQAQVNRYENALSELEDETKRTDQETDDLNESIKKTDETAGSTADGGVNAFAVALGNLAANVISKCVEGLKEFLTQTVELGKGFDSTMSQVQATSGATADEMEELNEKAKQLGKDSSKSAQQVAEGFTYMGMAGWDAGQMLEGVDGIVRLSEAGQVDLATASDIVTDALTAFGESAEDAGRLADIMAAASSNANTNVEMMGETFKYAAPLAGAMGYSMEDTAVAIGLMANSGIKASQAGTSLRSMFTRMSKGTKECTVAMNELGIELTDDEGNMNSLHDMMSQLRDAFGSTNMPAEEFSAALGDLNTQLENGEITQKKYDSELDRLMTRAYGAEGALKAQYAAMIAGANGMSGLLAIVNASDDDFNKLTDAINNSEGSASEMAKVMNDNLGGSITYMQSAFESLQLSIYENVSSPLKEIVDNITSEVLPAFTDLVNGVDGADQAVGESVGNLISQILTNITSMLPSLNTALVTMIGAVVSGILDSTPQIISSIATMWTNIMSAVDGLVPQLLNKIVEVAPQIARMIANLAPMLAQNAVNLITSLVESVSEVVPVIANMIPELIDTISTTLINNAPNLLAAALKLWDTLVESLNEIIPILVEQLPKIIESLTNALTKSIPVLLKSVTKIFDTIAKSIPKLIPPLLKAIPKIITPIVKVLTDNIPVLLDGAIQLFMAIIDALPEVIEALIPQIPLIISTIVDVLLQNIPMLVQGFIALFAGVINALPEILYGLGTAIETFVAEVIDEVIVPFTDLWSSGWEDISAVFTDALDTIKLGWSTIGEFFSGVWNNIKDVFATVGTFFSTTWTKAKQKVSEAFSPVKTFFSETWTAIKNTFSSVGSWFKTTFTTAWTNVKGAFANVGEFFGGIWETIKSKFTDIGTKVGDAIGGTFKAAINSVLETVENAINAVPDAINGALDVINKIPGVDIDHMGYVSLPRLAKGGIVNQPTIAEIGEAGKEAVIPLEKNKAGLKEIASLLGDEITAKLPKISDMSSKGSTVYNFNQTNNSPKALSRYEIYRQTKNLINAAKGV